jgi:hypothetical protein
MPQQPGMNQKVNFIGRLFKIYHGTVHKSVKPKAPQIAGPWEYCYRR